MSDVFAEGAELARGYRVVSHLSRGRTLDAYAVWSDQRDCLCVAKVLRPEKLDDRSARRRLRAEGRLVERLSHPHIVRAYELVERPQPVLVLEALTGETLAVNDRGAIHPGCRRPRSPPSASTSAPRSRMSTGT